MYPYNVPNIIVYKRFVDRTTNYESFVCLTNSYFRPPPVEQPGDVDT